MIPKSNDQARLVANLKCDDFTISEADMAALDALNINFRVSRDYLLK